MDETERILKAIIACLVEQLGGEARISFEDINDPPDVEAHEDLELDEMVYWSLD